MRHSPGSGGLLRISIRVSCLALLAGALLGCDSDPATPPEPVTFALSADQADDFAVALEDLEDRVLPHLGQPSLVADLDAALGELSKALGTRRADDLTGALQNSDHSVAALETGPAAAAIAADLESVRLVLNQARRLLEAPPAAQ